MNKKGHNSNRVYKRRIKKLIYKVLSGDKTAELELGKELSKSSLARWVVERFIKLRDKNKPKPGAASNKIRARKSIYKGNAFKPYQGGLPSLGKR